MKLFSLILTILLGPVLIFAQKNPNFNENVPRTPSGDIRCLTMEADARMRAANPVMGSIEDFEQWLAPRIEEYKR